MNVRCPVCSARYEVQLSLLTAAAMRVSCPACGGVSRLAAESPDDELPTGSGVHRLLSGVWQVRRGQGLPLALPSLQRLRELVRCGELQADDEVRCANGSWRPLAAWQELQGDFSQRDTLPPVAALPPPAALPAAPAPPAAPVPPEPPAASPAGGRLQRAWPARSAWLVAVGAIGCALTVALWAGMRANGLAAAAIKRAERDEAVARQTAPAAVRAEPPASRSDLGSVASPAAASPTPVAPPSAVSPRQSAGALAMRDGRLALRQRHKDAALRHFAKAVALGYADGWLGIAAVERRWGSPGEARRAYLNFLQAQPHGPKAERARQDMAQLASEATANHQRPSP